MSQHSWRKSGDHQGEQACHRRTPDRRPRTRSSEAGRTIIVTQQAERTFSRVDHAIFRALWQWAKRRHPQEVQTMDQKTDTLRPSTNGIGSFTASAGREEVIQPVWLLAAFKCADPATYQGQRGSESLRPRLGTVLRGTSRREDGRDPGGPMDSAAALEGARRYLSGLQPEDHHGDGVAQPPYRVANPWGQGYAREPRAGASELPSTDPQPRVRCGKAASCKGRSRGLSCMKGIFHVQFLGEGVAATSPPYPTPGWATTPVYLALAVLA